MVDHRKASNSISSQDYRQRFSPSQISDTVRAGFETVKNLSSGFSELSCAEVITTSVYVFQFLIVFVSYFLLDPWLQNIFKNGPYHHNMAITWS